MLTYNGVTDTIKNHAERAGVNYSTLKTRLKAGWSLERAFNPKPEIDFASRSARSREVMRALNAAGKTGNVERAHKALMEKFKDPTFYPPAGLPDKEREQYKFLVRKKHYRMAEAMKMLGYGHLLNET
jgi:hypothetical protein